MSLVRTGVGSLPHTDPAEAVRFVVKTTDIPYLPQLPNRHSQESMLPQWGAGIAGAGVSGTQLAIGAGSGSPSEAFVGATAMLPAVRSDVVKTQATGPVTLAAALRAGGAKDDGLLDEVVVMLLDRINDHVAWVRRKTAARDVVVVLDEPTLAGLDPADPVLPSSAVKAIEAVADGIDAEVGLHCCGDTDWGGVADIGLDWLSWDVSVLGAGFVNGVDRIARALGDETRLIWGIVPTTTGPLPDSNVLVGRYGTAVANLVVAGAPTEKLKSHAWFSPACGMAGLSVPDAEAVTGRLDEVLGEVESGW